MHNSPLELKKNFNALLKMVNKAIDLSELTPEDLLSTILTSSDVRNSLMSMDLEQISDFLIKVVPTCAENKYLLKVVTLLAPNLNLNDSDYLLDIDRQIEKIIAFDSLDTQDESLRLYVSDNEVLRKKIIFKLSNTDNTKLKKSLINIISEHACYHLKNEILANPRLSEFFKKTTKKVFKKDTKKLLRLAMQLGDPNVCHIKGSNFQMLMKDELLKHLKKEEIKKFDEKFQFYSTFSSKNEVDNFITETAHKAKQKFDKSYTSIVDKILLSRIYDFEIHKDQVSVPQSYGDVVTLASAIKKSDKETLALLKAIINSDDYKPALASKFSDGLNSVTPVNIRVWLDAFATIVTNFNEFDSEFITRGIFSFVTEKYDQMFQEDLDKTVLSFYLDNQVDFKNTKSKFNDLLLNLKIPDSIDLIEDAFIYNISNIVKFIVSERDFEDSLESKRANSLKYYDLIDFIDNYQNGDYSNYELRSFFIDVANIFIFSSSESALSEIPMKITSNIARGLLGLANNFDLVQCYEEKRNEILLSGMLLEVEQLKELLGEKDLRILVDDILYFLNSFDYDINQKKILKSFEVILDSRSTGIDLNDIYEDALDWMISRMDQRENRARLITRQEANLFCSLFDISYILESYGLDGNPHDYAITSLFNSRDYKENTKNIISKAKKLYHIVDEKYNFQVDFDNTNNQQRAENVLFKIAVFEFSLTFFDDQELNFTINKFKDFVRDLNNEILNNVHTISFIKLVDESFGVFLSYKNDEITGFLRDEIKRMQVATRGKYNKEAREYIKKLKKRLH